MSDFKSLLHSDNERLAVPRVTVIVFPNVAILPGDRVVAKTTRDEILAKELVKTSVNEVRLALINAVHSEIVLLRAEVV